MKKIRNFVFILILIIILIFLFVNSSTYENNNSCLNEMKINLTENLTENETLNFKESLNCFEWNNMMFLHRDFSPEYIEKNTGIKVNGFKTMGFKYFIKSDFYTHILFLKDNKIVGIIETSKGVMIDDFATELNNNDTAIISKEDAIFKTYETENEYFDGRKVISLTFADSKLIEKYKHPN